jgi:hypothetical protein
VCFNVYIKCYADEIADGMDKSVRALSTRVDIVLKMLGLRGAANTIVGDGTLRGVSGNTSLSSFYTPLINSFAI